MKKRFSKVQCMALGLALAPLIAAGVVGAASQSPYTSLQGRDIKALSREQIEGYETGQGMGFALAAELNGYPGPKHVLELQEELDLSEAQLLETERAFTDMKDAAESLGRQIVAEERDLDRFFASHAIDAESLAAQVVGIAELRGRLRAVHLQTHLEMMEILREDQVLRYIELRGYHGSEHQGHHSGGSHDEQH